MDGKTDVEWQEDILHFWFGGDQQINYHTKWFPDGGGDVQARTDQEIYEKYYALFQCAMKGELQDRWTGNPRSTLALIITLDQFSRHIFRYQALPSDHELRLQADRMALALATRLQAQEKENSEVAAILATWPIAMMVFALMPYRHNASIDRLEYVLQQLDVREGKERQGAELMARFRKQTVRRLQHLQDRARLEETNDILEFEAFRADETNIMQNKLVVATEQFLKKHLPQLPYQREIVLPLLEKTSTAITVTDSSSTNDAIMGDNSTNDTNTDNSTNITNNTTSNATSAKNAKENVNGKVDNSVHMVDGVPVANLLMISLSGGVDSMVISKILALLQRHQPSLHIDGILAVHIDYANRPESGREAAYVRYWSGSEWLQLAHCHVRLVNEVTRGITDRDAYEKIARNIRYSSYQEVIAQALQGAFLSAAFREKHQGQRVRVHVSGVMFGHHLGDVQENIISNVMRGSSPLYLSGMTEVSITNHVHVWRPLLAYTKDDIYAFSHQYGVPYFKDSTPSWSTRGKLRNQLLPLLLEIYGAGCLTNLSNLAYESDQMRALVHSNLYAPFLNSVRRFPCGLAVNILAFRQQPTCFWREVLKLLMHSMSMSLIRDKAVGNFTERIQRQISAVNAKKLPHLQGKTNNNTTNTINSSNPHQLQYGWLELRKGFHTFLTSEGDLLIFQDGVLRKNLVVYNVISSKNQSAQRKRGPTSNNSDNPSDLKEEEKQRHENTTNPKELLNSYLLSMLSVIAHIDIPLVSAASNSGDNTTAISTSSVNDESEGLNLPLQYAEEKMVHLVQREYPEYQAIASNSTTILSYGPWAISISGVEYNASSTADAEKCCYYWSQAQKRPLFPQIMDALPGSFSYDIYWPVYSSEDKNSQLSFVFLKDVIDYLEDYRQTTSSNVQEIFRVDDDIATNNRGSNITANESYQNAPLVSHVSLLRRSFKAVNVDFRFMDVRLRDGLPLLIPFVPTSMSTSASSSTITEQFMHYRVNYRYQGKCADEQGSTGCEVH